MFLKYYLAALGIINWGEAEEMGVVDECAGSEAGEKGASLKYALEIVSTGLGGGLDVGLRERESRNLGF